MRKDFMWKTFCIEQLFWPTNLPGTKWLIRGDEEGLRSDVDYALRELGVEYIDIIVLCRVSPSVPIEERWAITSVIHTIWLAWNLKSNIISIFPDFYSQHSVRVMASLVKEGKARNIGLSEASASTIRKANAVSPIYCIEQVWHRHLNFCWSLWYCPAASINVGFLLTLTIATNLFFLWFHRKRDLRCRNGPCGQGTSKWISCQHAVN